MNVKELIKLLKTIDDKDMEVLYMNGQRPTDIEYHLWQISYTEKDIKASVYSEKEYIILEDEELEEYDFKKYLIFMNED